MNYMASTHRHFLSLVTFSLCGQMALAVRTCAVSCDWLLELEPCQRLLPSGSKPSLPIARPSLAVASVRSAGLPPGRRRKSSVFPCHTPTSSHLDPSLPLPLSPSMSSSPLLQWHRGGALTRAAADWEALPRQAARKAGRQGGTAGPMEG